MNLPDPRLALLAFLIPPSAASSSRQDVWSEAELARVSAEIRSDVEKIRGKSFLRPVAMKITDKAGFIAHAKERMDDMVTPEQLAGNELMAKMLGLIPADMDLMKTTMAVLEEQVGGFYVPNEDTFYIMEQFVGAAAKIILAHELTHALDDQLYNIDDDMRERVSESDSGSAYSAVVEGSGTLAMNVYTMQNLSSLDPESLSEVSSMGTESMEGAPPFIWLPLLGSYLRGSTFLLRSTSIMEAQTRDASAEDLERAFTDPPHSTEQILHPEKYWDPAQRDDPRKIEFQTASVPEGWEVLYQDTLGEMLLALLVQPAAKRPLFDPKNPLGVIGIEYTNPIAQGWGGDRLILLSKGEGRLLRLVTVWDSERDAGEFYAAMSGLQEEIEANLHALAKIRGSSRATLKLHYGTAREEVILDLAIDIPKRQERELFEQLTHSLR